MTLRVTWAQATAWRLERHLLEPLGDLHAEDVVRRLCGVQAQVASSADLAVRVRQREPRRGEVARALLDGRLIKTWAMRGTLHLLAPDDAGAYLALMVAGRWWERPSWERYFGLSAAQMQALRSIVREILSGRALTREELVAEVTQRPGFEHVGEALRSGWGSILKPLAWQGDLCFGPSRGTRVSFMLPEDASRAWAGVPDLDEAWPRAILAYLGAYGPATMDNFAAWLSRGTIGKRQLRAWFTGLGDRLTTVDVDGQEMYLRSQDVDGLAAARPAATVRLLPGFDGWVLGPGTDDPRVVPVSHRRDVSRQSGWIAPVVLVGGIVSGTWEAKDGDITIDWFAEAAKPSSSALAAEIERVSALLRSAPQDSSTQ